MDSAIAKAMKEREELKKRLAEIDQFLRMYDEFAGTSLEIAHSVNNGHESSQNVGSHPRSILRRGRPGDVATKCREILRTFGVPLTRRDLTHELERKNVSLPGEDRESRARYVGTILWRRRHDDFEHIDGEGYWLK